MTAPSRPPLGVVPRAIWSDMVPAPRRADVQARARALLAALDRYDSAGLEPPAEWRVELVDLELALARHGETAWSRERRAWDLALIALAVAVGLAFGYALVELVITTPAPGAGAEVAP